MTDDEAFVRRIVASPGDDLPRLVYADWLDEHDDLRGAYLRAEVAAPGDVTRLTPLTVGLCSVWIARISRPPVGGCCAHVRFTDPGPPVGEYDLASYEAEHMAREAKYGGYSTQQFRGLPSEYRAFLLNHNGCECEPCSFSVPEVRDEAAAFVATVPFRFHCLGEQIPGQTRQGRGRPGY